MVNEVLILERLKPKDVCHMFEYHTESINFLNIHAKCNKTPFLQASTILHFLSFLITTHIKGRQFFAFFHFVEFIFSLLLINEWSKPSFAQLPRFLFLDGFRRLALLLHCWLTTCDWNQTNMKMSRSESLQPTTHGLYWT